MILDSSMVEHPAVNRRVVGSSPTRGVSWWRCVYGKHPYPCRTRRLSHRRPMILGGGLPGKVGGCQLLKFKQETAFLEQLDAQRITDRLKNLVLTLITRTERMRTACDKRNVRPRDLITKLNSLKSDKHTFCMFIFLFKIRVYVIIKSRS